MRPASAKIIWNPKKPWAKALAGRVSAFLRSKGVSISSASARKGILITIGGDGTLLYNKSKCALPIFAIGTKKSFICQSKGADWRKKLGAIIRKGFKVEKRAMLECLIRGKIAGVALNEIALRSRDNRVLDVNVSCGTRRAHFYADGVLFSTPTGSTAYCYSCGGKELPPLSRKYEIVGIAPHRRAFKPMLVPDSASCTAWTGSESADLVFDGQSSLVARRGERLRIRKSRKAILLVRA